MGEASNASYAEFCCPVFFFSFFFFFFLVSHVSSLAKALLVALLIPCRSVIYRVVSFKIQICMSTAGRRFVPLYGADPYGSMEH